MRIFKKTLGLVFVLMTLLLGAEVVSAAEANPFTMDLSQVHPGVEEFEVSVDIKEPIALAAFDFTIQYDAKVLELVTTEEQSGYSFTQECLANYEGGAVSSNHKSEDVLAFAVAKTGVSTFSGKVVTVHFRVIAPEAARALIKLQVNTVARETADGRVERMDIDTSQQTYVAVLKKLQGDVNQDGKVDLNDAQLALKAALKIVALDEEQVALGDMDQNGKIELADAQVILKKALKIIL